MAESRRLTYLDTKAVVVYSINYVLKKHNLCWIGQKPSLPVKFSPLFYHIIQKMLDLYDENFETISGDMDLPMLQNPGKAIENVGNGILKKCHLPMSSSDNERSLDKHLVFTPPQFLQSNVIALVYFAAVLAVKLQLKRRSEQSVNGSCEEMSLNGTSKNRTLTPPLFPSNATSMESVCMSNSASKDNMSLYSNGSSNFGYRTSSDVFTDSEAELSPPLNTIQIANRCSSFINCHMGYFIDHYGGWESWVSIPPRCMSNPQSPDLSERQEIMMDDKTEGNLNQPPLLYSRSSRSTDSTRTPSTGSSRSRILRDAGLTSSLDSSRLGSNVDESGLGNSEEADENEKLKWSQIVAAGVLGAGALLGTLLYKAKSL